MSTKQITAKRISRARVGRDAWVYELSKPVHYELRGESLTTSYVTIYGFGGRGGDDKPSVVIYPSDQYGDVLSYGELPGSHVGDMDHDKAVRDAGWTLDGKSIKRNPPSAEEARECVGPYVATEQADSVVLCTACGAVAMPKDGQRAVEAHDFPSQSAAVEHAYRQRDGERMFVYHEAGKFHLAAPGQEPVGATRVSSFRRPGEYQFGEAREDTAPVIYEEGAREQPGKLWPAPGSLASGSSAAQEHIETTVLGEGTSKGAVEQGGCLPWVRVTRDPERYDACLAQAREIGPIDNPRKVYDLLAGQRFKADGSPVLDAHGKPVYGPLAQEDVEVLMVVLVDVRRQLRGVAEVHRGQRSRVGVGIADVLRIVITTGAEGFVLVHNHASSGNSDPSQADRDLTKQVEAACKPYGSDITFIDHVVVGRKNFFSLREDKKYTIK